MSKKFFNREVKIGLSFIVAIAILIIGINFLKGINVFTPSNHYFIAYENLDGLVVSNNVMIKGYKVGQVRDIYYNFSKEKPFTVHIAINDDIKLPLNTQADLYDDGIVGGKAIELVFRDSTKFFNSGDTIPGVIRPGLFGALEEMLPQLQQTIGRVDSVVSAINDIVRSEEINNSLSSIENMAHQFEASSIRINNFMNNQFPHIANSIDTIAGNLQNVTQELEQIEFVQLVEDANATIKNLKETTDKLNSKDNTIGLLINDKAVYDSLQSTVNSANQLLIDLKENPKRYVHFSVFGKKDSDSKK